MKCHGLHAECEEDSRSTKLREGRLHFHVELLIAICDGVE